MNAPELLQLPRRFYGALADADVPAILATLDPNLRADITAGLPDGWGGIYEGAPELLARCWQPIFAKFDVRPHPHRYLPCGQNTVVVHGEYRIRSRATGSRQDAAFIHILELADGRIHRLVQVTDSARWHEASRTRSSSG